MASRLKHKLMIALSCFSMTASLACGPKQAKTPVEEAQPEMTDAQALDRYHGQKLYGYCDARVLAGFWGLEVDEAKVRMGRSFDDQDQLDEDLLDQARERYMAEGLRCDFYASGYTYDDAQALAALYEMDIMEAKALMDDKLTRGDAEILNSVLMEAHGPDLHHQQEEEVLYEAWDVSEYNYCDAFVLGELWDTDSWDGKITIGYKLINGYQDVLQESMTEARIQAVQNNTLCDWRWEFAFEDVDLLASYWDTTLDDSKARVSTKLTYGDHKLVRDLLAKARQGNVN